MKTIMIVDDQAEIRELVEITLGISDYNIVTAADGESAKAAARKAQPDLIILDVMMGGRMEGYEVCRDLKADPATADCRVIMLTGRAEEVDRERGLQAGADDYFTKPFSPLELINKVEEMLG